MLSEQGSTTLLQITQALLDQCGSFVVKHFTKPLNLSNDTLCLTALPKKAILLTLSSAPCHTCAECPSCHTCAQCAKF